MSTLIGRLLVGTRLDDSGFRKGAKSANKQLSFFEKQTRVVSKSVTRTLGQMGAAFAIGNIISNAANSVVEFDQKVANLAATTGRSKSQIGSLVDNAREVGAVSAFSASQVLDLQTELAKLGNSDKEIINMTKAVGDFSIAVGATTSEAATLTGGVLKSFGKTAEETEGVVSSLAVATTKSALDFTKLQTALPIVGTAASEMGLSIERTTALLGVLADRNIDASTSGTALRNIFLDLKKQGLTYDEAMAKINNSTDSLNTANELFGKRGAVVATVLSKSSVQANKLEESITGVNGALKEMTDERLNTIQGRITLFSSAWEGMIQSIEKGDGIISQAFKGIVDSATGIVTAITGINQGASFDQFMILMYGTEAERSKVLNDLKEAKTIQKEIESGVRLESGGLRAQRGGGLAGLSKVAAENSELQKLVEGLDKTKTKSKEAAEELTKVATKVFNLNQAFGSRTPVANNQSVLSSVGSISPGTVNSTSSGSNVDSIQSNFDNILTKQARVLESNMKLEDSYRSLGEAVGNSLAQGANSFEEFASNALKSIQQVVSGLLKQTVASALASVFKSLPFPLNVAAAPAVGGIAAGLFNTAINSLSAPKLAEGGVIRKPTFAMLGEYPGATSNPEIAAPESKLRNIFSGELQKQRSGGPAYSKVMGDDLYIANQRATYTVGRTG